MLVNMILHSIVKSNVDEELKKERLEHQRELEHQQDEFLKNLSREKAQFKRDEMREERNILRKELQKLFIQELSRKLSPRKTFLVS